MIFIETQKYHYVLDSKFIIPFFNGHIRNVVSTWLTVVKIDIENDNVVSTLPNVVYINVEIDNVGSTSQRRTNLTATLKQRWNVAWEGRYTPQ